MIDAAQIEIAKAVRIEAELERRGFRFGGRGAERAGPCPICGGTDRFSINVSKGIWNCRGCGKGGDVIALVQHVDGCSFADAIKVLAANPGKSTRQAAADLSLSDWSVRDARKKSPARDLAPATVTGRDGKKYPANDDEIHRLEQAVRLFDQAERLGADAIKYFERRGIDINAVPEHGDLRWHPKCPFDGETKPCILGRYTAAIDNQPRGIWRRPIDGSKPKAFGPVAGCVIRLWADDAVTLGLVLGEGIETTLAAATRIIHNNTLLQPAWAAGFAGNMASFPVLAGIDAITLLVDHDESGTGQRAADECAARWRQAGREVIRLTPTIPGYDFNNVVQQ